MKDIKEIKKMLESARAAKAKYLEACGKVNELESILMSAKKPLNNRLEATESKENTTEKAYCKLADYTHERSEVFIEYLDTVAEVEKIIQIVPNSVQREVLRDKYIIGLSINQIADNMLYSVRHVKRLHIKALLYLSENVP